MLQHYVDPEEGLPYNPAPRIKRKKPPEQPPRYYTEAQVKVVLDACKQSTYERLHFLAVCALVTGARRSELLNLRWNQVNLERGEA